MAIEWAEMLSGGVCVRDRVDEGPMDVVKMMKLLGPLEALGAKEPEDILGLVPRPANTPNKSADLFGLIQNVGYRPSRPLSWGSSDVSQTPQTGRQLTGRGGHLDLLKARCSTLRTLS